MKQVKLTLVAVLLLVPLRTTAQVSSGRLSALAIDSIVSMYNREGTVRLMGDSRIAAGDTITSNLAVLEGSLVVAGRVRGDVLVFNGDLELQLGGHIDGRAVVLGGTISGPANAVARGVTTYRTFGYELHDGMLSFVPRRRPDEFAAGRSFDFGRTDIIVTARPGYNRVEGLPILLGPRLTLGHSNPTILEGLITYRTAAGLEIGSNDLGYSVRAEQFVGGMRAVRFGLRAYEEIAPIETVGISDRESSLAAFVLHRDYRDHYEREGIAAYLRVEPPGSDVDLRLEYADEHHNAVRARRPWSLIDNAAAWRIQPLAAYGSLRRITASIAYDTRNLEHDPAHGWWIDLAVERGLGGSLRERFDQGITDVPRDFWHGLLDLRRYARLGPSSRLAVRLLAIGSIDGAALPVQRQHTLGGEGSLPGFALHQFNCSAGNEVVRDGNSNFQRNYGCDRAALLQLEYQSDLTFLARLRGSRLDQLGLFQRMRLVGFVDAGRAWTEADARGVRDTGSNDFAADAGFGIKFGRVGAFWAIPVSGSGQPMNFFIRIGPRF